MSETPKSPSPRRRFIANLIGGTAALAVGGVAARDLLAQGGGIATYPPPQGGWDLSWADRLEKAKHKCVFDCAEVGDGLALTNAQVYLAGFRDVYNTPDSDLGVVVVIRHRAIQMVLNDSIWERWKIGEQLSIKDPVTGNSSLRNTFAGRAATAGADAQPAGRGGGGGGGGGGGTIQGLMARGVTFLCCNLALMRSAGQFATAMSVPADEARKLFIDSLVPGVIRQTNGIFGVTRAQEAGAQMIKST